MTTLNLATAQPHQQQIALTLPLCEAETQLRHLVEQTQTRHQPIIFTGEESAQPLAILIEPKLFERLQRQEQQIFHLHLQSLLSRLDGLHSNLDSDKDQDPAVQNFIASVKALNDVYPHPYNEVGNTTDTHLGGDQRRSVYLTLKMASQRLSPSWITHAQINALRDCVKLLRGGRFDQDEVIANYQALIECGLPPMMAGNNSIVQMYTHIL